MFDNLQIRVEREPFYGNSFAFLLRDRQPGSNTAAYGVSVIMETFDVSDPARANLEPTFRLSSDAAQLLIDELWRVGLRPTEGTGSAGALSATQAHLEDMRKLVFNFIDKTSVQVHSHE